MRKIVSSADNALPFKMMLGPALQFQSIIFICPFQKDLTKKDLIKILGKIESERTRQNLKEYSLIEEDPGVKTIRNEAAQSRHDYGA